MILYYRFCSETIWHI